MTPDTPTTATAAIFEKYPRPWRYTGFDYRDATGKLILTDEIPPAVIVSAVNSAGADKQLLGELKNEVFNLRSALVAAREDIENAVKCAKEYCPDYPWTANTASEAVWATGESLRGTEAAIASWEQELAAAHERIAKLQHAVDVVASFDTIIQNQLARCEVYRQHQWNRCDCNTCIALRYIIEVVAALSPSVRPTPDAGEKPTQEQLRQKHGDPFDFAQACFRALGDPLTRDEVIKAIADYWNDWNRAAVKQGVHDAMDATKT